MKPGDLVRIKPIYEHQYGKLDPFPLFDLEGGLRECGIFPRDGVGIFLSHKHPGYSHVQVFVNGVFGSISEDFIEVVE